MFHIKPVITLIAASSLVLLASCTKSDAVHADSGRQEITFRPLESEQAPTKADPAQSVEGGGSKSLFGTDKAFYSCAFYLREGKWDAGSKKEFYIGGEKDYSQDLTFKSGSFIKYDSRGRCWRYHTGGSAYSLYWPGTGTLTFFAWTDNTTAPNVGDDFSCSPENGVKFKEFSILLNNRNRDLMVAEIAKDQTCKDKVTIENGEVSYAGVPTVFHHILSKMEFRVQKQGLDDKEVRLKEIKFIKFSTIGTYTQLENGKDRGSGTEWTGQDGDPSDKTGWEFFSCGERAEGMKVVDVVDGANVVLPKIYTKKESGDTEKSDGLYLYIPQSFKDNKAKLHIKYTVAGEDKEAEKSLEDVYPDGWEIGKKHIVTITITDGNTGGTTGGSIASLYAPDTAAAVRSAASTVGTSFSNAGIRSAVSTTAAVRSAAAVTGSVTFTGTTATDSTGSTALILTTETSDWEPVTSNLSF